MSKPPFTTKSYEGQFSRRVIYAVHGFQPEQDVSATQSRATPTTWREPSVSWSGSLSGRDSKAEPDDAIAAECFAKAILAAVKQSRKWQSQGGAESAASELEKGQQ